MKNNKKFLGFFVVLVTTLLFLPFNVKAADAIDVILTNGELIIDSVAPTNTNEAWTIISELKLESFENYAIGRKDDYSLDCNSTYTECVIVYEENGETFPPYPVTAIKRNVKIKYNYDSDVKKAADTIIKKLPTTREMFALTDMEFINYLLYRTSSSSLADFSGELKKYIDYTNFNIEIETRGGTGEPFYVAQIGITKLWNNNKLYYVGDNIGTYANLAIYVPTDTEDSKIKEAIEKRITDTFGDIEFSVEKSTNTVSGILEQERQTYLDIYEDDAEWYKENYGYNTKEEYADAMIDRLIGEDGELYFLNDAIDEVYKITINGREIEFAIIKDSTKINNKLNYVTRDIKNDITISTDSTSIPLDTLINASKLTSGKDYEKIEKLFKEYDKEIFDLKLYSKSLKDYINKLDDGTFEVKIPISKELKNKKLVVYYFDEDGKKTEYEVTIKDGYAYFTTNHFSVYTLASTVKKDVTSNKEESTSNPATSDSVILYFTLLSVSIVGLISGAIYVKKSL